MTATSGGGAALTRTQAQVCAICARILGLQHVELDDDLYELGSDSHHAILVALEIERTFGVSLPIQVMETSASPRALAAWVEDRIPSRVAPGGVAEDG